MLLLILSPICLEKWGLRKKAIIAADIASKSGDIEIGFIDRFSGALLITGDVSAVESALQSVIEGLQRILGFFPTDLTRS